MAEEDARESALLRPEEHESFRQFARKELPSMWALGWPIAVSMFCRFAMFSMDSAFVGHLGNRPLEAYQTSSVSPAVPVFEPTATPLAMMAEAVSGDTIYSPKQYLAASSLSDMVTNFLTTPLLAMSFGLNPLIAQSMGSGNLKMVGTWLKLSMLCVTLATIPFVTGFFFVDDILTALHMDPDVCYLAGIYAKFNAIWVLPNSWYLTMRVYFQAQGKARPAMYFGLTFLFVNLFFLWILVDGGPDGGSWWRLGGLGFIGAALSISCSRIAQAVGYWLYMFVWKKQHKPTWPGHNCDFLQRKYVKPYFAQVLPQVATMLLQFLISQSTTLLVGKLGVLQVASSTAATQATVPVTICLLITFSSMTGIRVGMKLGKGEAQDAKRTAYLCMLSQACMTALFACIVLPLRKELMSAMTSDPEVQSLAGELLIPIVLNFLFAGAVSTTNGGILASQGRTHLSAALVMLFELPFSLGSVATLVLVFHADVRLVYWTQAGVTLIECFVVLLLVCRSDWAKYARDAQARNRLHEEREEPASSPAQ